MSESTYWANHALTFKLNHLVGADHSSLSYDVNGSGKKAAVQFATLTTGLALTNADFWVI